MNAASKYRLVDFIGCHFHYIKDNNIMRLLKNSKDSYALSGAVLGAVLTLLTLQNTYAAEATEAILANQPTLQRALPPSYYSDAPRTDEQLTSLIVEQLTLENGVDISKLNVQTIDGVVKVSGTAANETIIKRIIQIGSSAGYVKWIESTVTVE